MAGIRITNSDGSGLNYVFSEYIAKFHVDTTTENNANHASYWSYYNNRIFLTGENFIYNENNLLVGGTITSISWQFVQKLVVSTYETYTNIAIPVSLAVELGKISADARPLIYAGNDNIAVDSSAANGFAGNDSFYILGAGHPLYSVSTTNTINGGLGANTAILPYALRSEAMINGGGGNETVYQSGITSTLIAIDKLQFLDGSVYEDNATPGGQAALIFEGIFGRLPDAINAGGYGRLAEQVDTSTAARAMLATPEAQGAAATLNTVDFVARLYRNMLHRDPNVTEATNWQDAFNRHITDRATTAAQLASSIEAQQVNATVLASGSVFGADPNSVDVLRAYEVLLGRSPEASALGGNINRLNSGTTDLAQVYKDLQGSAEFASAPHVNGLSAGSSFAAIQSVALSDQTTALITPLVTNQGISTHA